MPGYNSTLAATLAARSAYILHDLAENGLMDATLAMRCRRNVARVIGWKPSGRDLVLASKKSTPKQRSEKQLAYG